MFVVIACICLTLFGWQVSVDANISLNTLPYFLTSVLRALDPLVLPQVL